MSRPPADVPAVFRDYLAGLEEQRPSGSMFQRCFGCGPAHPSGLHVRCFRTDEGVVAPIVIPREFEGPPGVCHGGIVAGYLDEILTAAAVRGIGRSTVTGELTVRYVKPVPTETPILGSGRILADHGRYVDVEGRLETFASRGLLATARGRFFPIGDSPR